MTAGTYRKALLFNTPEKRDFLLHTLLDEIAHWGWNLQAWAVLANHYHFVATSPEEPETLKHMLCRTHSKTAVWLNRKDATPGRKVWFQYRDTCLTHEESYRARLRYVHENPVKHGLVALAENYPWCSMAWFMKRAPTGFRRSVLSFKIDALNVDDEY